jgi:hypothetical protein
MPSVHEFPLELLFVSVHWKIVRGEDLMGISNLCFITTSSVPIYHLADRPSSSPTMRVRNT